MENLLLLFVIIFIFMHMTTTMANPRTDLIYKSCGTERVANVTKYNENYYFLLKSMEEEMTISKYAVAEEGEPPNRVYALAHCMKDLSEEDCGTCFSKINTILPGCFPKAGSRVLFDGCFMRIDNYAFYTESYSPDDSVKICSEALENSTRYRRTARELMDKLVYMAPNNDGFDKQDANVTDHLSVHTMANCWGSLGSSSCSSCLGHARDLASQCFPSGEGRALMSGCFVRYSDFDFANEIKPVSTTGLVPYLSYIMLACVLATVLGYVVGVSAYNKYGRRKNKSKVIEARTMESPQMMKSLHFKYSMLEKATNNFSESNKIGQGGFGQVYKGVLPDGRELAIKRLFASGKLHLQEVFNEVDSIANAQHRNLVRYLGCCLTNDYSLLIYEFLPNRSLDVILFDPKKKRELDWKKRFGIIKGTAEGLKYLHNDCQVRIVHRDIKASNILLDLRHRPKIADFGLASFSMNDQVDTGPVFAGTLGYMSPEYLARGKITDKVDVYSFGVLVLEIVGGIRNSNFQSEDSLDTLVTATWKHFKENKLSEIIDRSLEIDDNIEEILRVIKIGLLCTQESAALRPSMKTVTEMLRQKNVELPTPSKPPFILDSVTIDITPQHQRNHTRSVESCQYYDAEEDDESRGR